MSESIVARVLKKPSQGEKSQVPGADGPLDEGRPHWHLAHARLGDTETPSRLGGAWKCWEGVLTFVAGHEHVWQSGAGTRLHMEGMPWLNSGAAKLPEGTLASEERRSWLPRCLRRGLFKHHFSSGMNYDCWTCSGMNYGRCTRRS